MAPKNLTELLPMVDTVVQGQDGTVVLIVEEANELYSAWMTDFKLAFMIDWIPEGLLSSILSQIGQLMPNWTLIGWNGSPFAEIWVWTKWIDNKIIANVSHRERGSAIAKDLPAGVWLDGEDTERLFNLLGRKVEEVNKNGWPFHSRLAS